MQCEHAYLSAFDKLPQMTQQIYKVEAPTLSLTPVPTPTFYSKVKLHISNMNITYIIQRTRNATQGLNGTNCQ